MPEKRALNLRMRITRENSDPPILPMAALLAVLAMLIGPRTAAALTSAEGQLLNQGFQIFNAQTFNGNGRTCSTCHLPQSDFTIGPADLPTLSAHQRQLVFGTNIRGGNAGQAALENSTILSKLLLFNTNEEVGGSAAEVGTVQTPVGPFRASMSIAGLALTSSNLLPDFCGNDSPPELIENGTDLVKVICSPLPLPFPASAIAFPLTDVFLNTQPPTLGNAAPGVDDGTRNIELGWSGDGTIADPDVFGASTSSLNQNCKNAIDEANANISDLTGTLRAFSLTAVKTHLTRSLNRVPGVDFRCPTAAELDALAAFQEYLGRRFELALKQGVPTDADDATHTQDNFASGTQTDPSQPVITFNDATAETGKAIFLDGNAQCNLCHFNAGANDATGLVHAPNVNDRSAPFPQRNFTSKQLVDLLRCTDANGSPSTCLNGSTATAHGLNATVAPVIFPQDPGDKVSNGATAVSSPGSDCNNGINSSGNTGCVSGSGLKAASFNLQSLIEAPRKGSFFHNGAFTTLEGALSFYFSPTGDEIKAFAAPRKGETGAVALATLANTYFSNPADTQNVLNTMGFFLRSLSVVYSLADCERLVSDSLDLIKQHQPTTLQTMLCTNDLKDVTKVIGGARVSLPAQYSILKAQIPSLQIELQVGETSGSSILLSNVLNRLITYRHSIATITPDLAQAQFPSPLAQGDQ
jgi:cytochrome c peroxidase